MGVLQWKMSCCNCAGGALIHPELESAPPPVVTQSRSGTWRIWSDETSMAQLIESPVLFLLIPSSPSTSQDPWKWVTSPLHWRATAVRGLCFPTTTFCNDPRSIACQLGWGKRSASFARQGVAESYGLNCSGAGWIWRCHRGQFQFRNATSGFGHCDFAIFVWETSDWWYDPQCFLVFYVCLSKKCLGIYPYQETVRARKITTCRIWVACWLVFIASFWRCHPLSAGWLASLPGERSSFIRPFYCLLHLPVNKDSHEEFPRL